MKKIGDDIILNDSHILSEEEQQVLFGLADGKTPTEIKQSVNCDNMHLRNIEVNLMMKLGAKSKTHLISRAFSLGLLVTRTLCLILVLGQTFGSYNNQWTRIASSRTTQTRIARPATRRVKA